MDSRRSSSAASYASTSRTDEASPAFKNSLRENLDLWVGSVPLENDPSFQSLIQGNPGYPGPEGRLFEPKDQHCGIWKDASNKECHASMGDQGTTASVSSYGDLMQMSQFLGAGSSGVFSIDHRSTAEPYLVVSRADDLNRLGSGNDDLSFGLDLPGKFVPGEIPKMRWVNWRWPRYEWEVLDSSTNAKVSLQWLVKNNTVLQQVVITNTGSSSIEDFSAQLKQHILIRDLDYLDDPSFNERNSQGYIRGRGPNGFSWITANFFNSVKSSTDQDNDTKVNHATNASINQQETGVEDLNAVEQKSQRRLLSEAKRSPSDDEVWQKRRISDTWSAKDAHAVVSVMSLFVNGNAVQMGMEPTRIRRTIGASGSSSSVLEITVAYKMIVIPKGEVHWKNFLIPAEATDVGAMLAVETEQLWGHSSTDDCKCSQSLCDLHICKKDFKERDIKRDASGRGQTSHDSGTTNVGAKESAAEQDDTSTVADLEMGINTAEVLASSGTSDKQNVIQDTRTRSVTEETMTASQKLSPLDSIEYFTWRHTEHILSACTIPLSVPLLFHQKGISERGTSAQNSATRSFDALGTSKGEKFKPEVSLAITCGDMAGHRICTSASFFAFEFLIGVLRRLPFVEQVPYVVSLQRRIDAVCRGHIRWLEWVRKPWLTLENTESLLGTGCFAANYWVNGTIMTREWSASWQPEDAITDTPFQILKVTAYIKWFQKAQNIQRLEDKKLRHFLALLRDVWVCWINELDDLDKRKACAWRHASEDGVNTYRLDDHFWLWNSLSELHYLDLWSLADTNSKHQRNSSDRWVSSIYSPSPAAKLNQENATISSGGEREEDTFLEFSAKAKRLLPKEVQRAVLQRFTVENDVSQERMLAVTRSARETRFFFHTRDTALFYGHDRKFFLPDTPFSELWERTIRSQSHHEETLEEERQSPLRSALGAVAGLKGFSIDKRRPSELLKQSVESLMKVSAHNAFMPGEMDITTKGPSIFSEEENRDYYYHVGFEVCHILLEYAGEIDAAYQSERTTPYAPAAIAKQIGDNTHQPHRGMNTTVLDEILAELKKQRAVNHQHASDYRALAQLLGADGRLDRKRTSMAMKKSMPFNNMIDASSITTVDEEWLYNYPDFLLTKNIDLHQQLKSLLAKGFDRDRLVGEFSPVIVKALAALDGKLLENFPFSHFKLDWAIDGLVASLPKQKSRRRKRGKRDFGAFLSYLPSPNPNEELWDTIGKARYAMKAKKRFLWLPLRSNPQTALLCWLASTEAEKPAMSLFFDRHAEYENHLWDDTTMVLNVWQTELHMSFWVIYEKRQPLFPGLPHPIIAPWPRGPEKELRRASMSFRFDGDFFDRYWTCHFIQYVPGVSPLVRGVPGDPRANLRQDKQFWQRKVLEVQLLQHMLGLILVASNKILNVIETELGLKKGNLIFSVLTTEAYSLSEDRWQIYEELLQKAEEDITSSLSTLSKWATREVDRGQERPRWTRNDERKYRGYINKLRNQTERQRWDLENCRDKMCKLRETLITRRDNVRADLEANREQNIRYFTYVTVIFLPLGFASSFYSMNGAPSNDLIVSLAKFAAAAFAVTAILVFGVSVVLAASAKALSVVNSIISGVKQSIYVVNGKLQKYSHNTRLDSLLVKGTSSDNEVHKAQRLHQAYFKKDWMVSHWFWPAYIFLEVPTRIVSSAWTTLGAGNLSVISIWRVAIGIVVLPIYAISRAVLILFGNSMLLLTISRHLYQLFVDWLTTKRNSEEDHMPEKKVASDMIPHRQAVPRPSSFKEPPKKGGDAENITTGNRILPDHFKQLMPTTEPLELLRSFESRLNKQRLKVAERKTAQEN